MKVNPESKPKWLQLIAPESFNDVDLFRIVIFFVFHSPCSNLSAMSRTLEEYGWSDPWKKKTTLRKLLIDASSNQNLLHCAKTLDEMSDVLKKSNLNDNFPSDLETERIGIYNNSDNQFMSVFFHLRNSFAHCRLNMVDVNGECVFILEDINRKYNAVTARMILRKNTLLKWIDIIESGQEFFDKDK